MEKIKLKKWVKILLTVIILIVGLIIYNNLRIVNAEIIDNYLPLIIIGWLWLIFGQLLILIYIWEN